MRALACPMILALSLLAPARPASAAFQTYISLGDSTAFGETDFTRNPSYGDRGYVAPFADYLASRNSGLRPSVVNLGIDAETSSSFFNGGANSSVYGLLAPLQNLNYTDITTPQNSMLLSRIGAEHAAGRSIAAVSISLGSNDLVALASSPGFLGLPFDQQLALFQQTLGVFSQNLAVLLTELETVAPEAGIFLLGGFNADGEIPGDPLAGLSGLAIDGLNGVIAQEAAGFGANYVDLQSAFAGHIADYTYAFTPPVGNNTHPNALGYSVIANQMISSVPEPSSLALCGMAGIVGLVIAHVRRGRAKAA